MLVVELIEQAILASVLGSGEDGLLARMASDGISTTYLTISSATVSEHFETTPSMDHPLPLSTSDGFYTFEGYGLCSDIHETEYDTATDSSRRVDTSSVDGCGQFCSDWSSPDGTFVVGFEVEVSPATGNSCSCLKSLPLPSDDPVLPSQGRERRRLTLAR